MIVVGAIGVKSACLLLTYVLGLKVFEVVEYYAEDGTCPFVAWYESLDRHAALKVRIALALIERGNLGDVKTVGAGVSERKIDFGPGYRVYFGKDGDKLIILLGGGTKKRQSGDIAKAQTSWADYKRQKRQRNKDNGTN
jgi:putative addiction module killer protein